MNTERIETFLSRISILTDDDCWLWKAGQTGMGRGCFYDGDRYRDSHRIAWEMEHGPIHGGLCVCHHCDNGLCCNPAHMFLGTRADNVLDMVSKGRHSALKGQDHPLAKLTASQVEEIRSAYLAGGVTQADLAKRYGVTQGHVSHVVLGRSGKKRGCWNDGNH